MRCFWLGYLLLGVFFAMERRLREGDEARSFHAGASDRGTTRLIGAASGSALVVGGLAPLLSHRGWGHLADSRLPTLGLGLMGLGLALKAWAMRTLGRFYTRTLRAASDQPVIDAGPYRLVRHPGYLGALLLWLGFGLAVRNWLATLSVALALAPAYLRRIHSEESLLVETLGEPYAAYRRRTWRLLPGVY
jgi:protein-S-isoprenylcysteine O-methyltransferase Ste14